MFHGVSINIILLIMGGVIYTLSQKRVTIEKCANTSEWEIYLY